MAAQLVETRGDLAGALRMLEGQADRDPIHLVRLLYRSGDTRRAERVFTDIETEGPPGPGLNHMPRSRTFKAVWPFLIEKRLHEMAG